MFMDWRSALIDATINTICVIVMIVLLLIFQTHWADWQYFSAIWGAMFCLSVATHVYLGSTIGQRIKGFKIVRQDGAPILTGALVFVSILRQVPVFVMFALGPLLTLLFVPGIQLDPGTSIWFRSGTYEVSGIALLIGLILWPIWFGAAYPTRLLRLMFKER